MMMNIFIADSKQLTSLTPLFNAYRTFYKQPPNEESSRLFLTERLKKNDSVILLATVNNTPAGFVQLYPGFSSVTLQPLYILNDLYVAAPFRKQGVGSALLKRAKQFCVEMNYKGLALQTAVDNPAQQLYEKLGWKKDMDLHYFWTNPS